MKRGELVILWIGGILSSLVLLLGSYGMPGVPSEVELKIDGADTVAGHVVQTVFVLLAIWIICGLVWVSIYRRKP
jgi:hypothetical protein